MNFNQHVRPWRTLFSTPSTIMICSGKIWHFKFYSNAVSCSLDIAQQCKVHFNISVRNWFFLTHVNLKLITLNIKKKCTFWSPYLVPWDFFVKDGQIRGRVKKSLQPSFFSSHGCILYKGGSVYINYEPLSFMPCNMDSVASLVALRH